MGHWMLKMQHIDWEPQAFNTVADVTAVFWLCRVLLSASVATASSVVSLSMWSFLGGFFLGFFLLDFSWRKRTQKLTSWWNHPQLFFFFSWKCLGSIKTIKTPIRHGAVQNDLTAQPQIALLLDLCIQNSYFVSIMCWALLFVLAFLERQCSRGLNGSKSKDQIYNGPIGKTTKSIMCIL